MQDNWNETLPIGKKGEKHFLSYEAYILLRRAKLNITDIRSTNREGEFLLPDGSLLEVKTDGRGNMLKTKNLFVEIKHKTHAGWYHHCKQNGVAHMIFEVFRKKEKLHPAFVLYLPFGELVQLIETEGKNFKQTMDGMGLLVPLERVFDACPGALSISAVNPKAFKEGLFNEALEGAQELAAKNKYVLKPDNPLNLIQYCQ